MSAELAVGFDLDMTLIETTEGFAATLDALAHELDVDLPSAELSRRLGPPLDVVLRGHLEPDRIEPAVQRFRQLYPETAVERTPTMAGAHEALAAVRREHGKIVLVTGKFAPNAQLHVDHLGLDVDLVVGMVWGVGKAEALRAEGVSIYVGDHVHDVEGAKAAGAVSVSVLTGGSSEAELRAAGTDVVLPDLGAFPEWLAGHVRRVRVEALLARLAELDSLLVAFSGGADSAFLLAAAARALGPDRVLAATAYSDSLPRSERDPGRAFAESLGVRLLTPQTDEMSRDGYRRNAGDRCAFCKAELLDVLGPVAADHGIEAVATGTNADDARAGFRPGIAAARARGAITPLLDAGLSKAQIRATSREWGLPTWDKPAAACLSSRVAYGIEITPARLARVERAEAGVRATLRAAGREPRDVRVRDVGEGRARIEVDRELVVEAGSPSVIEAVHAAGFDEVEVDPLGFRSGAMNELLADPERYR